MKHSRHLFVYPRALKFIDDAAIALVFWQFVEKIQDQVPLLPALLFVDNSEGVVAFGDEPCDCPPAPEETA